MKQIYLNTVPTKYFVNSDTDMVTLCSYLYNRIREKDNIFKLIKPSICHIRYTNERSIIIYSEIEIIHVTLEDLNIIEL